MSAPIYLYTGPEAGEKNDQILALKEELHKKMGSSDDFVYYGTDLNMSDVVAQLMTESLFIPATFVTIRNAELVKDKKTAVAVRLPSGDIHIKTEENPKKRTWAKIPIVRGVIVFVNSLIQGTKTLMYSADVLEKYEEKLGDGQ